MGWGTRLVGAVVIDQSRLLPHTLGFAHIGIGFWVLYRRIVCTRVSGGVGDRDRSFHVWGIS
jgi:hypothetical protein